MIFGPREVGFNVELESVDAIPVTHASSSSMPKMPVETGSRTMRIAIACLVLMACKGAKPASSNNGSQTSGS